MGLVATQELFWRIVAERRPVTRATLESVFLGTPDLSAAARLEIYASMYVHRLVDALGSEFPEVRALVGEDAFFALAEAYIREYPSRHPSVVHLGRDLPRFLRLLRRRTLARRFPVLGRSDLADIATLERTRSLVFEARDESPMRADVLARLPPAQLGNAVLIPVAALALVKTRYNRRTIAVFRRDHAVQQVGLERREARAVSLLLERATLAEICAVFADDETPAVSALGVVGRWIASGWISGVRA